MRIFGAVILWLALFLGVALAVDIAVAFAIAFSLVLNFSFLDFTGAQPAAPAALMFGIAVASPIAFIASVPLTTMLSYRLLGLD